MIHTTLGHLQINVKSENVDFYKDLMTYLGWSVLYQDEETVGVGSTDGASLWFTGQGKDICNDYDGTGMNHLALNTPTQGEVDKAAAFLRAHDIPVLFDTPRHRPEFCGSVDQTYYQVMFESPDRILFEVVYRRTKD